MWDLPGSETELVSPALAGRFFTTEPPGKALKVFYFSTLNCMSCLYILEIKHLLVTLFANIFSQSVGCLFILFIVSFAMPKLISLIRSQLFIFAFTSITLGD